jgi:hypothetical protein
LGLFCALRFENTHDVELITGDIDGSLDVIMGILDDYLD